jgi:hypothetical protein
MKLTHFRFGIKVTSIFRKVVIILKLNFRVNFKCLILFCYNNEKKKLFSSCSHAIPNF